VNALQIALAALAAALIGTLGWMTDWGQDFTQTDVAEKSVVAKVEGATVLPDFKLGGDTNAYPVIAEKPLLNPTRKPAPTQPIAQVAPEPPKPQIRRGLYQLVGVADLGNVRVAQVKELAGGRVRSVRQGDQLQEMNVRKIDRDSVTLEFQGETDVIEVARFTASGRVPQPPTAPPPIAIASNAPPPQPMPQPTATAAPRSAPAPVPSPTAQSVAPPPVSNVRPDGVSAEAASDSSIEARRARRAALLDPSRQNQPRPGFGPGPSAPSR
jgi:hypothetical protein